MKTDPVAGFVDESSLDERRNEFSGSPFGESGRLCDLLRRDVADLAVVLRIVERPPPKSVKVSDQ